MLGIHDYIGGYFFVMASKISTDTEKVADIIGKHEPAVAEIIRFLRDVILETDPEISEQVKWNSPAFYYTGDMKPFDPKEYKRDIVVMNLHRGRILLVFPTGARINDTTGILEGKYTDGRKMVTIADMDDARARADALQTVLRDWLAGVEKEKKQQNSVISANVCMAETAIFSLLIIKPCHVNQTHTCQTV